MSSVPPPPNPGPEPKDSAFAHRVGDRLVATLPFLRDFIHRVNIFAAESSWKRIAVLGFVVLIAVNIIGDIIGREHNEIITHGLDHPIDIQVHNDKNGIVIQPIVNGKPGKTVQVPLPNDLMDDNAAPNTPVAPDSGKADTAKKDSDIDHDALRLERNGKRIVIDSHGVRLQQEGEGEGKMTPPAAPAAPAAPGAPGAAPAAPDSDDEDSKSDAGKLREHAERDRARAEHDLTQAQRDRDQAEEDRRRAIEDSVKDAMEDSKDDINQAIADAVAKGAKVSVHRGGTDTALWDFLQIIIIISFAYVIAIKVSSSKTQRADAMVRSASMVADRESLQRQVLEARLQTMQAQVEPHFLFNTLASVDYLIETDPKRASKMQKNLIQYLRAALPQMREAATHLGREVDLVRAYLEILKVRMEERLQVEFDVPEGLRSADFPPMMLQSLVENAIKHGLEPKAEGGSVKVAAEVIDGDLFVSVSDTGLGFKPGGAGTSGGGVGMSNIRERLMMLYGGRSRFLVEPNLPSGTRVSIVVPYQIQGKRNTAQNGGQSS